MDHDLLIHWSREEGICSVTPKRRKTSEQSDSDGDCESEKANSISRELSKRLSWDSGDSLGGVQRIYGIRRSRGVSSVSMLLPQTSTLVGYCDMEGGGTWIP